RQGIRGGEAELGGDVQPVLRGARRRGRAAAGPREERRAHHRLLLRVVARAHPGDGRGTRRAYEGVEACAEARGKSQIHAIRAAIDPSARYVYSASGLMIAV